MLGEKVLKAILAVILVVPLALACGEENGGDEDTSTDTTEDTTDTSADTATDDGGVTCFTPEIECGGVCVDPRSDPDHCGACDNACTSSEACECYPPDACMLGTCVTDCTDGMTLCDRSCVDTDFNVDHCGECGNACEEGMHCGHQVCTAETCAPGQVYCFGRCADLNSDMFNCGECGIVCDIDTQYCQEGRCVDA